MEYSVTNKSYSLTKHSSYLFPSQIQVDTTIRKISGLLGSSRNELHIFPNSKGFLSGAIALVHHNSSSNAIDCLREFPDGWCIPGSTEYLNQFKFENLGAQYIVVIEKHGIFKRLLEDRFVHHLPSILICGLGYPSIATKFLFQRIARELRLPCLGLVDYNPHGLALLQTYRSSLAKEASDLDNQLSCSSWRESTPLHIYWLGLHFSQLSQLNLWDKFRKPLTRRDRVLLTKLRNQLQTKAGRNLAVLEQELNAMQNGKVELQAIYSLGHSYLSRTYLPSAIFHYEDLVPRL
ncbi:Topoisomerase 6 subunit A3 [Galdieria sulphuraria]|nr:Topoisomerase 6 subunit A3 [Galdieria sulphuraria]